MSAAIGDRIDLGKAYRQRSKMSERNPLNPAFVITGTKVLRLDIITACEGDLPEILALQRTAFHEVGIRYDDPDTPPLPQTLNELTDESKGQVFLKAVLDNRIIGAVRCRKDGNVCRISKVMVHPDHQDGGIGQRLMAAAENVFDVTAYELRTGFLDEKNISLYKKLGFVIVGEMERITPTLWFIRMRKERTRSS